ncbi:hypothetical protein PIB30_028573 [Stylosanthes scabra]|uniref:Uncharacterized protein n=1 Tax=Stylosanthes scabra TaxID=79078 RepID=A0ABU6U9T5_9FABA|nr:hypothetical protein [Stylosanthes scabra]
MIDGLRNSSEQLTNSSLTEDLLTHVGSSNGVDDEESLIEEVIIGSKDKTSLTVTVVNFQDLASIQIERLIAADRHCDSATAEGTRGTLVALVVGAEWCNEGIRLWLP